MGLCRRKSDWSLQVEGKMGRGIISLGEGLALLDIL